VPEESGYQFIQRQLSNEESCYTMFRMGRLVFYNLHEELVNNYGLTSSDEMCSIEALGMFYGCAVHLNQFGKQSIFLHIL
jgi:hypothetical protein